MSLPVLIPFDFSEIFSHLTIEVMQKDFFNQNDINKFVKWTALHEFVKNCMDGTLQPLLDEMDNETNFSKFTLLKNGLTTV